MSGSSEAYSLHRKQITALIQLIREGKNETAEADALRDDMDDSWYALSDLEKAEIREISETAYQEEKDRKKEEKV